MIEALNIGLSDAVIEFAPGLGTTARLALKHNPATYTAVERDNDAAALVNRYFHGSQHRCVVGFAENTGLPSATATVVYGEAMLSMQPDSHKSQIVREAFRLLRAGGRYAIHELCLIPDELDESIKLNIHDDLAAAIHHGTLTIAEWRDLLESEGFSVQTEVHAPMNLLRPWRIVRDEGMFGALRFAFNLFRNRPARRRILAMRQVFAKYQACLAAVMLIAHKRKTPCHDDYLHTCSRSGE
jgi:SAM-dependent methyltransferase